MIPAGLLVVALGADPQVEWLQGSGLDLDGGVVVGADGLAAPAVAAAGGVARWPHPLLDGRLVRMEHYSNAIEQGRHAARALLGAADQFAPLPSFWCHIYDLRLQAIGFTGDGYELHLASYNPDGRFLAEYRRDGCVVGALTAGFARALPRYREEITWESARRVAKRAP